MAKFFSLPGKSKNRPLDRGNDTLKGVTMLQTIEVEIDAKGHIHPLEALPLPQKGKSRALLTILPATSVVQRQAKSFSQ